MGEYSILFYLLIIILVAGVLQSTSIGFLFFFKRSGVKRANYFYGLLLITIGLTLLHNIFHITNFYKHHPRLSFLPIYFTLAFPSLLFYYVKLNLYPSYRLKKTDIKHFILPIGQVTFFAIIFMTTLEYKSNLERYFYNPFYGAFEQFLYLSTFFSYLYFSYRYIRRRRKTLKHPKEKKQILYLKNLVKILFILFGIHSAFVLADFISYEFLNINLRVVKPYAALSALSFAALVFWLGTYGFQVLFWGRKVFGKN